MNVLVRYHCNRYIKSNKYVMPMIVYIIYLGMSYRVAPLSIVSSFIFSVGIVYLLMVWIGFSLNDLYDPVEEQITILKTNNINKYYLSKVCLVGIIGATLSAIGIIYPVVSHVSMGNTLFKRSLTVEDIIIGFLLHCLAAVLGGLVGILFHPRVITDRKFALLLVLFFASMGYIKGPLQEDVPMTGVVSWVFPPLYQLLDGFAGKEFFELAPTIVPIFYILAYSMIITVIHVLTLQRKGF